MQKIQSKERVVSLELKSKRNLKNLTLTNGNSDTVLLEGSIGELIQATFTEGIILEIIGKNGVLRVDLGEDEIKNTPQQTGKSAQNGGGNIE
jgi:hypothetical protein